MVTADQIVELAQSLPRSEPAMVRGSLRFRVRSIVWLALSPDETKMSFAFPREMREALVNTYPDTFHMPRPSELRWNWVVATIANLDDSEWRDIVLDAWRMVVPKKVALAQLADAQGANR